MKSENGEPVKIIGVVIDEVGEPRNDRSPGSSLYAVPFQLSRAILDGTTIEEVKRFHLETLKLAVAEANRLTDENEKKLRQRVSAEEQRREQHRQHVAAVAKDLKFD